MRIVILLLSVAICNSQLTEAANTPKRVKRSLLESVFRESNQVRTLWENAFQPTSFENQHFYNQENLDSRPHHPDSTNIAQNNIRRYTFPTVPKRIELAPNYGELRPITHDVQEVPIQRVVKGTTLYRPNISRPDASSRQNQALTNQKPGPKTLGPFVRFVSPKGSSDAGVTKINGPEGYRIPPIQKYVVFAGFTEYLPNTLKPITKQVPNVVRPVILPSSTKSQQFRKLENVLRIPIQKTPSNIFLNVNNHEQTVSKNLKQQHQFKTQQVPINVLPNGPISIPIQQLPNEPEILKENRLPTLDNPKTFHDTTFPSPKGRFKRSLFSNPPLEAMVNNDDESRLFRETFLKASHREDVHTLEDDSHNLNNDIIVPSKELFNEISAESVILANKPHTTYGVPQTPAVEENPFETYVIPSNHKQTQAPERVHQTYGLPQIQRYMSFIKPHNTYGVPEISRKTVPEKTVHFINCTEISSRPRVPLKPTARISKIKIIIGVPVYLKSQPSHGAARIQKTPTSNFINTLATENILPKSTRTTNENEISHFKTASEIVQENEFQLPIIREKRSLFSKPIFGSMFNDNDDSRSFQEKFFKARHRGDINPLEDESHYFNKAIPFPFKEPLYQVPLKDQFHDFNKDIIFPFKESFYQFPVMDEMPVYKPHITYGIPQTPASKDVPFGANGVPSFPLFNQKHVPERVHQTYDLPQLQKGSLFVKPHNTYGVPKISPASKDIPFGANGVPSFPLLQKHVPEGVGQTYDLPQLQKDSLFVKPHNTYGVPKISNEVKPTESTTIEIPVNFINCDEISSRPRVPVKPTRRVSKVRINYGGAVYLKSYPSNNPVHERPSTNLVTENALPSNRISKTFKIEQVPIHTTLESIVPTIDETTRLPNSSKLKLFSQYESLPKNTVVHFKNVSFVINNTNYIDIKVQMKTKNDNVPKKLLSIPKSQQLPKQDEVIHLKNINKYNKKVPGPTLTSYTYFVGVKQNSSENISAPNVSIKNKYIPNIPTQNSLQNNVLVTPKQNISESFKFQTMSTYSKIPAKEESVLKVPKPNSSKNFVNIIDDKTNKIYDSIAEESEINVYVTNEPLTPAATKIPFESTTNTSPELVHNLPKLDNSLPEALLDNIKYNAQFVVKKPAIDSFGVTPNVDKDISTKKADQFLDIPLTKIPSLLNSSDKNLFAQNVLNIPRAKFNVNKFANYINSLKNGSKTDQPFKNTEVSLSKTKSSFLLPSPNKIYMYKMNAMIQKPIYFISQYRKAVLPDTNALQENIQYTSQFVHNKNIFNNQESVKNPTKNIVDPEEKANSKTETTVAKVTITLDKNVENNQDNIQNVLPNEKRNQNIEHFVQNHEIIDSIKPVENPNILPPKNQNLQLFNMVLPSPNKIYMYKMNAMIQKPIYFISQHKKAILPDTNALQENIKYTSQFVHNKNIFNNEESLKNPNKNIVNPQEKDYSITEKTVAKVAIGLDKNIKNHQDNIQNLLPNEKKTPVFQNNKHFVPTHEIIDLKKTVENPDNLPSKNQNTQLFDMSLPSPNKIYMYKMNAMIQKPIYFISQYQKAILPVSNPLQENIQYTSQFEHNKNIFNNVESLDNPTNSTTVDPKEKGNSNTETSIDKNENIDALTPKNQNVQVVGMSLPTPNKVYMYKHNAMLQKPIYSISHYQKKSLAATKALQDNLAYTSSPKTLIQNIVESEKIVENTKIIPRYSFNDIKINVSKQGVDFENELQENRTFSLPKKNIVVSLLKNHSNFSQSDLHKKQDVIGLSLPDLTKPNVSTTNVLLKKPVYFDSQFQKEILPSLTNPLQDNLKYTSQFVHSKNVDSLKTPITINYVKSVENANTDLNQNITTIPKVTPQEKVNTVFTIINKEENITHFQPTYENNNSEINVSKIISDSTTPKNDSKNVYESVAVSFFKNRNFSLGHNVPTAGTREKVHLNLRNTTSRVNINLSNQGNEFKNILQKNRTVFSPPKKNVVVSLLKNAPSNVQSVVNTNNDQSNRADIPIESEATNIQTNTPNFSQNHLYTINRAKHRIRPANRNVLFNSNTNKGKSVIKIRKNITSLYNVSNRNVVRNRTMILRRKKVNSNSDNVKAGLTKETIESSTMSFLNSIVEDNSDTNVQHPVEALVVSPVSSVTNSLKPIVVDDMSGILKESNSRKVLKKIVKKPVEYVEITTAPSISDSPDSIPVIDISSDQHKFQGRKVLRKVIKKPIQTSEYSVSPLYAEENFRIISSTYNGSENNSNGRDNIEGELGSRKILANNVVKPSENKKNIVVSWLNGERLNRVQEEVDEV